MTGILYLAGPMTGIPEHNFPLFNKEAARLRGLGWTVLNPAEFLGGDKALTRHEYVQEDLKHLLRGDVEMVALLPYWWQSRGAFLEAYIGSLCGMELAMAADIWSYPAERLPSTGTAQNLADTIRKGGVFAMNFPPPPVNGPSIGLAARKAPPMTNTGTPPVYVELTDAGRDWLKMDPRDLSAPGEFVKWRYDKARWEGGAGKPESICEEANRIVNGGRQGAYGHPSEDFGRTAALWSGWFGRDIVFTAEDVAMFQILLKCSRERHTHKRDNLTDICGYALCKEMVIDETRRLSGEM